MRIPTSLRSLFVLLLAVVLFASSCGDDAGPDGDATADEEGADPDDDGNEEGDDDGTDGDPPDGGDSNDGTDGDPPDGGDSNAYCALALEQEAAEETFDLLTLSPDELRDYYTESQARLRQAIDVAPGALRADLQRILEQFERFVGVLEDNDWDVFAALDDMEELADDPAMDAVDERLDAYDAAVCGIESDDESDDGDDVGAAPIDPDDPFASPEAFEAILGSETGRQLFAEGMAQSGDISIEQANCLIDNLDLEALFLLGVSEGEPTAEDLAGLFNAFDACGITPDQFLG